MQKIVLVNVYLVFERGYVVQLYSLTKLWTPKNNEIENSLSLIVLLQWCHCIDKWKSNLTYPKFRSTKPLQVICSHFSACTVSRFNFIYFLFLMFVVARLRINKNTNSISPALDVLLTHIYDRLENETFRIHISIAHIWHSFVLICFHMSISCFYFVFIFHWISKKKNCQKSKRNKLWRTKKRFISNDHIW